MRKTCRRQKQDTQSGLKTLQEDRLSLESKAEGKQTSRQKQTNLFVLDRRTVSGQHRPTEPVYRLKLRYKAKEQDREGESVKKRRKPIRRQAAQHDTSTEEERSYVVGSAFAESAAGSSRRPAV